MVTKKKGVGKETRDVKLSASNKTEKSQQFTKENKNTKLKKSK